jgi:hypothetical protein
MPPLAIMGGIAAAGSIGSAVMGSHAAGSAADAQANAAMQAAQLQHQDAQDALAFQKQQYGTQQKQLAPYLQTGTNSLSQLGYLSGIGPQNAQHNPASGGYGSLMQPFNGQVSEQNDPGYQFRLQQGQQALQRSAAAKGDLLSGGTAKALQQYGQDYASNEYQNTYNRYMNDQTTKYNRLASLAGVGQQAVGQSGASGQAAAGNIGNILMASGQQIGNDYQNAGAARASGYVGGANAWSGALGGGTNTLMQLMQLYGNKAPASVPYGAAQTPPFFGIGS